MSTPPDAPCAYCGGARDPADLDPRGRCPECRRRLIRRADGVAIGVAIVGTAAAGWLLFGPLGLGDRLLVAWLAVLAGLYFLLHRVVRRMAFAALSARAAPPEPSRDA